MLDKVVPGYQGVLWWYCVTVHLFGTGHGPVAGHGPRQGAIFKE